MNISLKELEDKPDTEDTPVTRLECTDIGENVQALSRELLGRTITGVNIGDTVEGDTVALLHLDSGAVVLFEYTGIALSLSPFSLDRIHPINPTQQ